VLVWTALVWIPLKSRELHREVRAVQMELQRGASTLQELRAQFKQDENRYASILQGFPWRTEGSEGAAFLARLGDVASGQSLRILAIGALQRQDTPEWTKVSRQVRLTGRFADILRLVETVEQNRGILEALKMQRLQPQGGAESPQEIEAQFVLVTVELPPKVHNRLRASVAALPAGSTPESAEAGGPLLPPVPARTGPIQVGAVRDPFQIRGPSPTADTPVPDATPKPVEPDETKAAPPEPAFPVLTLVGIIASPRGRVAIINNQMVREGEQIEGVLVQTIHQHAVVLKSPSAVKRLTLPELGSPAQLPGDQSR